MKLTFLGSLGMIQIWHALWNCSFPKQKSTELSSFIGTKMFRKKIQNHKIQTLSSLKFKSNNLQST